MLLLILVVAALQAGQMSRPMIVSKASDPGRRNVFVIYYDDSFLLGARHFWYSRDTGGNTVPGLFVHSKEKDSWIQITEISH